MVLQTESPWSVAAFCRRIQSDEVLANDSLQYFSGQQNDSRRERLQSLPLPPEPTVTSTMLPGADSLLAFNAVTRYK